MSPFLAGIKLVVIDNLSTLGRGKGRQNDEESWVPTQDWILSLRRRGISVLLVHHSGKNGDQRGTSAKEDVLDTVIQLKRPNDYTPAEGARFEVHFTKARGFMGDDAKSFEAKLIHENSGIRWETRPLEDLRLEKVKEFIEAGFTMREIAAEMNMGVGSVARFCTKFNLSTRKKKG